MKILNKALVNVFVGLAMIAGASSAMAKGGRFISASTYVDTDTSTDVVTDGIVL